MRLLLALALKKASVQADSFILEPDDAPEANEEAAEDPVPDPIDPPSIPFIMLFVALTTSFSKRLSLSAQKVCLKMGETQTCVVSLWHLKQGTQTKTQTQIKREQGAVAVSACFSC